MALFALCVGGIFAIHWADEHDALWLAVICGICSGMALIAGVVIAAADGIPPAWRRFLLPNWLLVAPEL